MEKRPVIRTYQYRVYSRRAQKEALKAVLQSVRFLYNHALVVPSQALA